MGKKQQGTMADQLKAVADRIATDKAAQEAAERKAKARREQDEAARRAAKEEALSDEERFERAVGGMGQGDTARKFDDVPARKGAAPPPTPVKKRSDDEVFLDAMLAGEVNPKR